ncbi:hypothetical protein [Aeromicrobium sp.]|uniref:hypothetical protein n=1 Tax=Aeromicrobium sp. TaxID=1871063 RepID=UPI003D6B0214
MPGTSPTTGFRRTMAGMGLIGFPLTGLVAALLDAEEGTETAGAELYSIAAAHGDAILASALVFMISAVLTVPVAVAAMHLVRERGTILVHAGAVLLVLGGFGHMGFATWQVMITRIPSASDEAALVAFLERQQTVMTALILPLLIAVPIGVLFLVIALRKSGVVERWFLHATLALFAFDVVLNSTELEGSKVGIGVVWAGLTVLFGHLGIRVLRMSESEWSRHSETVDLPGRV